MNEETKNAMDALAGGVSNGGDAGGDNVDWKAKYEEMAHKYQTSQVEQGRVKKLTEENNALKKQLDERNSSRIAQEVLDDLPPEVKEDVPEDILRAQTLVAQRAAERAISAQNAELQAIRDQMASRSRDQFAKRIEQEFPGFLSTAVPEGGDKHDAWVQYQRYNAASISAAVEACDFDSLSWHIRKFYTDELGIAPPSGGTAPAAADPSAIGGGTPVVVGPGKIYTQQEISHLYDEVEKARDRGDFAEVRRIGAEIDKAVREGRVK